MTDVIDTLEITGGRALASIDAAAVREAASNAGLTSDRLRAASFRVGQAVRALEGLALAPGSASTWPDQPQDALPFCEPGAAVRHRLIADDARALVGRLAAGADDCAVLRDRLLRAAGLYEQGESAAEKLVGGIVGTSFAGATFLASVVMPQPWKTIGRQSVAGAVSLVAAHSDRKENRSSAGSPSASDADDEAATTSGDGGTWAKVGRVLVTGSARWSDEVVSGIGVGIAAANPFASRFDFSVTGAARTLDELLRMLLPATTVRVREVRPEALVAQEGPTPTGTILSAFSKIEGLYGRGPHREPLDVPPATISVERVTHEDGTTAWVVVIPGTQPVVSGTNPFDGLSDIEIMAHGTAGTAGAVEAALDAAGATPDEPVVLIGHSLGGITAVALAASPSFRQQHRVGGVVTAGSPTASFATPPDVPVLHVENDEELVSNTDGRSGRENPSGPNRVTVTRSLSASSDPLDQQAAGNIGDGHGMPTHQRTYVAALESGNAQVLSVVEPIEALMAGTSSQTQYYAAERIVDQKPAPVPTPSPGPAPVPALPPTPTRNPLVPVPNPLGQLLGTVSGLDEVADDVPGLGGPLRDLTGAPLRPLTVAPFSPGVPSSG